MRAAIAPLFMFMKQHAAAASGLGVLRPHPRRIQRPGRRRRTSPASAGSTCRSARTSASRAGSFELVIVDEDAKINVNLGASNDIAHIRLAKQLMGSWRRMQYNPLFEQTRLDGQLQRPALDLLGAHRLGRPRRAALLVRPRRTRRRRTRWRTAGTSSCRSPTGARTRPTTRSKSCTWCAGVTDDFWSTFVDPDPTNPKKRVMTVWGQGRST